MNCTFESREIFLPASIAPYIYGSCIQPLLDGSVIAVWYSGHHKNAPDVGNYPNLGRKMAPS